MCTTCPTKPHPLLETPGAAAPSLGGKKKKQTTKTPGSSCGNNSVKTPHQGTSWNLFIYSLSSPARRDGPGAWQEAPRPCVISVISRADNPPALCLTPLGPSIPPGFFFLFPFTLPAHKYLCKSLSLPSPTLPFLQHHRRLFFFIFPPPNFLIPFINHLEKCAITRVQLQKMCNYLSPITSP